MLTKSFNSQVFSRSNCNYRSKFYNSRELETCRMELLRLMVNGGWSGLPTPEDAEDTEFRLWYTWYTNTDILSITKKQQSKKCDQQSLLKINCSCLPLSKHYVDKDNAVCRVEASILTGPLDNVSIEQAKRSTQDQSVFAGLVVYVVANATLRGNMITDWRVKLYCTLRSSWVFY